MLKALTRENIVNELRYLLKERYGTYSNAADQLDLDPRYLRRCISKTRAREGKRIVNRLNIQMTLLARMGYEVRFDIVEILRPVKAEGSRPPHAVMAALGD